MIRSKKYTDDAREQLCTVQIVGTCNHDPSTTVFAHFSDESGGKGLKSDDICGGDCCSACHDMIDGRVSPSFEWKTHSQWYLRRAMTRTLRRRIDAGIVVIK